MRFVLAATAALCACVPAGAAVYTAERAVGDGLVELRFETDNTLGTLEESNFVDWTISISIGAQQTVLSKANSGIGIDNPSAVSATETELLFDFNASGFSGFVIADQSYPGGPAYWCLGTLSLCSSSGPGEYISFASRAGATGSTRAGLFAFASGSNVIAVPEPGSWALMIAGVGLAGATLRRRHTPSPSGQGPARRTEPASIA